MPDVPKRCWYCERELAIGSIRVECAYCGADVARVYEWLDALDAARAEAERLKAENEHLHRRIEGLAAKIARQRAVISRLQAAVERRNSEERIEALRRALHDETVERYMREYDAAADEAERWRQQYEALRAGVEQVARDLNARTYIHRQLLSRYHDGAADAYEEAEQWVRHLLSETGGVSR